MLKKLLMLLPSLLQLFLALLPISHFSLLISCGLVLLQGGLFAWFRKPLVLSLMLTLFASMPNWTINLKSISIIYLLILNLLAYFCIKTVVAIYQK